MSLSARRAWIEIFYYADKDADWVVALRKESVDRNLWWGVRKAVGSVALRKESVDRNSPAGCWRDARRASLSARRAWIEMPLTDFAEDWLNVALRKESVDRNCVGLQLRLMMVRRSPQGERG